MGTLEDTLISEVIAFKRYLRDEETNLLKRDNLESEIEKYTFIREELEALATTNAVFYKTSGNLRIQETIDTVFHEVDQKLKTLSAEFKICKQALLDAKSRKMHQRVSVKELLQQMAEPINLEANK